MTEFFEVHDRDGAARVGELRLAESTWTPALADPIIEDSGSLWVGKQESFSGDSAALTVLPHRAFPAGTREEIRDTFSPGSRSADFPAAVVVSSEQFSNPDGGTAVELASNSGPQSETGENHPDGGTNKTDEDKASLSTLVEGAADAVVLSDAAGIVGHGKAFRDAIVRTRNAIPADTALYLSGVATPGNAALLAYAGVDLVDAKRAKLKGAQGMYLTTDGQHFLEDLEELPCACEACREGHQAFDRDDCAAHNTAVLKTELTRVRERIRTGHLRDYLEGQARHEQWITAAMREFDNQWGYLERRTPTFRGENITAATGDTIRRVEIRRFADRVTSRYRNRFDNPLVLVPCSATKPYSESQSHEQFHDAIGYRGHVVSMTSPIGVVPQELETMYPAQHYETVVTGRWTETETAFLAGVLQRYLERNDYSRVIAHVPTEGYREVCDRVDNNLGIGIEFTAEGHPTSDRSLAALDETLQGELRYAKRERHQNTIRAVADYQFGHEAGDDLFGEIRTAGRDPRLQVWERDGSERGAQLATMVPQYGVLALTEAGGRRWLASDVPTNRVEIDGFVPHGSVLAPGVVDAPAGLRIGEEVVIEGPEAFAVGRARMTGPEMAESTRGLACTVRHVTEK